MAEEIKKEGEEVAPVVSAPEAEPKTDPVVEDNKVDYVSELKIELGKKDKQLGQAEHTIIALKKDKKEKEEEEEDETPEITDEIQKIRDEQKKEFDKLKIDLVKDTVEDVLSSLTTDSGERDLIKFNYENRIIPSGHDRKSIQEDLVSAQLLANKSKLEKTVNQLEHTLESERGKNKGGSATGHNTDMGTVKLSDKEEAFVRETALRMNRTEEDVRAKLISNKKNY